MKKMLQSVPQAYVDRVLDPSELPTLLDDGATSSDALADGFRSWVVQTSVQAGRSRTDDAVQLKSTQALGQRVVHRRESINYGALEVTIDGRIGDGQAPSQYFIAAGNPRDNGLRVTVRSAEFPITPTMLADTAAGVIYSEVASGLARTERFAPTTRPLNGAGLRVRAPGWDLRMGNGSRGDLSGGPFVTFQRGSGQLSWLGGSAVLDGGLTLGLQWTGARAVPNQAGGTTSSEDVDSTAASASLTGNYLGPGSQQRLRLVHVQSRVTPTMASPVAARGLFAELQHRWPGGTYNVGYYKADPGLRYADQELGVGRWGVYGRMDTSVGRTHWGLGLVADTRHAQATGSMRYFSVNGFLNHRIGRRESVGGSLQASRRSGLQGTERDQMLSASLYYQSQPYMGGYDRFRLTLQRRETLVQNAPAASGETVSWERDWIGGESSAQRPQFVTSVGVARDTSDGQARISPTAGVTFTWHAESGLRVSGHLRATASRSNLTASRGLSGSLDVAHQLTPQWSLGASLSLNQARISTAPVQPGMPQLARSSDKFLMTYLRWEDVSGLTPTAMGMTDGRLRGAGSLEGVVFQDEDRDGQRQISENGMANVEVLLDGRFRATTDRNGRFVFPLVATGVHVLTLLPDSIPLPWGVPDGHRVRVDVPLRGTSSVVVPIVRVSE